MKTRGKTKRYSISPEIYKMKTKEILKETGLYELEKGCKKLICIGTWATTDRCGEYESDGEVILCDACKKQLSQLKKDLKRQADELTEIIEFLEKGVCIQVNKSIWSDKPVIKFVKKLKERRDAYLEGCK